ncbi:MAG: hypothetical protein IPO57_09145 [Rhodocyclales bacterium]|nr:hypothetical protein [Rhodocyclales bacterium]
MRRQIIPARKTRANLTTKSEKRFLNLPKDSIIPLCWEIRQDGAMCRGRLLEGSMMGFQDASFIRLAGTQNHSVPSRIPAERTPGPTWQALVHHA